MIINKIEYGNYIEFLDIDGNLLYDELLPPSLTIANADKDNIILNFNDPQYYYNEIDCVVNILEVKNRELTSKADDFFGWFYGKANKGSKSFNYLFMELHDISIFSIKDIYYHVVDSGGKRVDEINYRIEIGYNSNDCIRLIASLPNLLGETKYFFKIDKVCYIKNDNSSCIQYKLANGLPSKISKFQKQNCKNIEYARKDILKNAKKEILEINKTANSKEEKIKKFGIKKIEYTFFQQNEFLHLYKDQYSFKTHYREIFTNYCALNEGKMMLDEIKKVYPKYLESENKIQFEFKIDCIMDAFFGLAGLLEETKIASAFIDDQGILTLSFFVDEANLWLLLFMLIWLSSQGIGYYGHNTGVFYEANILKCPDILHLENLNSYTKLINEYFGIGDAFTGMVFKYYDEIINEKFLKYTNGGKVWKTELMLYLFTRYFYNDAVHIYSCDWLGPLTLDIYIPSIKFAIEFQGEQHYFKTCFSETDKKLKQIQERDLRKKKNCSDNGVKLIEIFYNENYYTIKNFAKLVNDRANEKIFDLEKAKPNNYGNVAFKDLLKNIHGNH